MQEQVLIALLETLILVIYSLYKILLFLKEG